MCRRILRPGQVPLLHLLLGVVLFSVLAAPVGVLADPVDPADPPDPNDPGVGGGEPDEPGDEVRGGSGGSGDGDPDDPIIDVPEMHNYVIWLMLLFTTYLP